MHRSLHMIFSLVTSLPFSPFILLSAQLFYNSYTTYYLRYLFYIIFVQSPLLFWRPLLPCHHRLFIPLSTPATACHEKAFHATFSVCKELSDEGCYSVRGGKGQRCTSSNSNLCLTEEKTAQLAREQPEMSICSS